MNAGRLAETDRLEAFSDGVMAVIITLMAFDIKPPAGTSWADVSQVIPHLLVYVLSFVFIGIYWNNHHHLLKLALRVSARVMWSNLVLLFWLSLLPVTTAWVAQDPKQSLPAACYGAVGFGAGAAYYVLVHAIIRADGPDSLLGRAVGGDRKGTLSAVAYVLGTGLAFLTPIISYAIYAAVAAIWFIPDRRVERVL